MSYTVRSIATIFTQVLLEKQTFSTLDGLLPSGITNEATLITTMTNGKAPEWVLWLYNMAVQTHLTELSAQSSIDDIEYLFLTRRLATERWYIEQALAFQYGDTLVIDPITYQPSYTIIDENKKIIGSCTCNTIAGRILLKVRKEGTDILTVDELIAFTNYINKIKIAGTVVQIDNYDGDLLTINMNIVYSGAYNKVDIQGQVETVITDYLNNIEFDSRFITTSLVDKLQAIPGVIDPQFNESSAIDALGNTANFLHEYTSNAGWCQIDTPLVDTITYESR
jgi:hypothetical protein